MKTHSINDIVYRVLTGEATDEDDEQLRLWLEESDEHRRQYEQLAGSTELLERYRFAEGIDVEKAWQLFRRRHLRKAYPLLKRLGRVAVVIVLLTGIAWWWNSQHSRPEKPQLPADVVTAIAHAEASGKNHALLTVAGQRIEVVNDKELAAVHSYKQATAAATAFISLPNFLPMVRKLHFTFFTRIPAPSTNFTSLTFTSCRKISFTVSIASR